MSKILYTILLHLIVVVSVIFGVNQCNKANEFSNRLEQSREIFNKANEIVEVKLKDDSSKLTISKPFETVLSPTAIETKNLLDSVSKDVKLTSNEKIVSYRRIPIQSSVTLKATNVTPEFAETENENWYARYYMKDSIFDLKYKTIYNSATVEKNYSLLGFNWKPNLKFEYDWVLDKNADTLKPMTINVIKPKVTDTKFQIYNTNKFRSFDNSLLSGAEANLSINRFNISGQYLYNFNYNKPEYEISIKYGIFKP